MSENLAGENAAVTVDDFELPGVPDAFQRLWTPHRRAYVKTGQQDYTVHSCPFCAAPERTDEESLIVYRGEHAYVVLNLYPYNPGHLLVCPYRHIPNYDNASAEETAEIAALTQRAMKVMRGVSKADGFNIGMNQGKVGGAGVAAHLHQHVLPRWSGDTNFLPIIAGTKTMTQTLDEIRTLLAEGWADES
ncbi:MULTISPECIES: HIT domain-containing protein [unclassified Rothia (in: high G+C Gram-positive bacteria)]|uniref:HIT family protein n=1 Tax=unclassified Rothia (in: high G+C Gram-positive bacteria) TaxID=2689056 RepID=UPI00195CE687|nr:MULTISPECIES: HIT domain-containing protein [unclassified Rothia (in: high G+C Gram-positive bacteria)]MBM7050468.1 HIT domain-containing protein [Rothia sp. ZJ1223]QRZ62448.1 HIT domain-containing protein [Rothia sp. ZJ932]